LIELLHDQITGAALDDDLGTEALVPWDHNEPAGIRANLLVLADAQLEQLVAPEPGAFAAKADRRVLLAGPLAALDALVDLAKHRLVGRVSLLKLIPHATIPS
jgi:hypothetical protein